VWEVKNPGQDTWSKTFFFEDVVVVEIDGQISRRAIAVVVRRRSLLLLFIQQRIRSEKSSDTTSGRPPTGRETVSIVTTMCTPSELVALRYKLRECYEAGEGDDGKRKKPSAN
jgi:hypothetical protein